MALGLFAEVADEIAWRVSGWQIWGSSFDLVFAVRRAFELTAVAGFLTNRTIGVQKLWKVGATIAVGWFVFDVYTFIADLGEFAAGPRDLALLGIAWVANIIFTSAVCM